MLLESLGVRMACLSSGSQASLTDPAVCPLPCNAAADCGIVNSFRGADVSWMRDNFTHVRSPAACNPPPEGVVEHSANASNSDLCGGSKDAALRRLQLAVRPEYRHPLRWGLKNPHSTYYVNALRVYFPCLVYINTVRDVGDLVRTSKHFSSRVQEAMRFGVLGERDGAELLRFDASSRRHDLAATAASSSLLAAAQQFYGHFIWQVNTELVAWTEACLSGRVAHVPLQRMVALSRRAHEDGGDCTAAVARTLSAVLRLDESFALNASRAFAARSLPLVMQSLSELRRLPLVALGRVNPKLASARGGWPERSALLPTSCIGELWLEEPHTHETS